MCLSFCPQGGSAPGGGFCSYEGLVLGRGVCCQGGLVPGGVSGPGGSAPGGCTEADPPERRLLLRTVRILLECILLFVMYCLFLSQQITIKINVFTSNYFFSKIF